MADEYISREAAVLAVCQEQQSAYHKLLDGTHVTVFAFDVKKRINSIPAADVVEVVRCKNCKYNLANIPDIQDGMNINENWNACQLTELYDSVEPMDFCSHGAKMDGGGE